MTSRDDLKSLIDRVPENRLEAVLGMRHFHINPPQPNPETERMLQRTRQYRAVVEQRFRETRKPGTIGGGGAGGILSMHEGVPFGRHSFNYWDEKERVVNNCRNVGIAFSALRPESRLDSQ